MGDDVARSLPPGCVDSVRGDQSWHPVRRHRPSLRGLFEPFLEAATRIRLDSRTDRGQGRCTIVRMGVRHYELDCADDARHRYLEAPRVPGWPADPAAQSAPMEAGDRRVCWGVAVPRDFRQEGGAEDRDR